jgi:hypothetical protein
MNVIFHTTTAIGVTVLLTDTSRIGIRPTTIQVAPTAFYAFGMGIISHGILDFIPHCYPINSKLDVIAGIVMILSTTWLTNRHFRVIMGLAFLGAVFPDIVDLGPKILNKQLNLGLTFPGNMFPWHWRIYSGSIYDGNCNISILNHFLLVLTVVLILWSRRTDLKNIFGKDLS